jgi:hypothetical protein
MLYNSSKKDLNNLVSVLEQDIFQKNFVFKSKYSILRIIGDEHVLSVRQRLIKQHPISCIQ